MFETFPWFCNKNLVFVLYLFSPKIRETRNSKRLQCRVFPTSRVDEWPWRRSWKSFMNITRRSRLDPFVSRMISRQVEMCGFFVKRGWFHGWDVCFFLVVKVGQVGKKMEDDVLDNLFVGSKLSRFGNSAGGRESDKEEVEVNWCDMNPYKHAYHLLGGKCRCLSYVCDTFRPGTCEFEIRVSSWPYQILMCKSKGLSKFHHSSLVHQSTRTSNIIPKMFI